MDLMVQLWMWNYNGKPEFGYHSEDIVHAYTSTGPKHRWVKDITDLQRAEVVSAKSVKNAEESKTATREAYFQRILLEPRETSPKVYAHTLKNPERRVFTRDSKTGNWYSTVSSYSGASWHPADLTEWSKLLDPETYIE